MGRTREDYRSLTGPQKAAMLMLALGEEQSSALFSGMEDEEIREISQVMANLGSINSETVERLMVEFADQLSSTGSLVGSYDSTERLLTRTLGDDRVRDIMEEIRGPAGRTIWDKLGNVHEGVLANYLRNEYPQTVSVVLSKLDPDHSARVLAQLPENFAMEVITRLLRMEPVRKEILQDVERTLRTEFMANLARTGRHDNHELLANVFNNMDANSRDRFINQLEERSRESADRIKQLMFTFEDLARLDATGIQTLLRHVEKDKLSIALKGGSDTVKKMFFENMSERAGKMLQEDMDSMGPVRLREVEESQNMIVALAKDLADKGEIVIAEQGGDDQLIY